MQQLADAVLHGDAEDLRSAALTEGGRRDTVVATPRGSMTLLEAALWRGDGDVVAAVMALPGPDPLSVLPPHGSWAWVREAPAQVARMILDDGTVDLRHPDADGRTVLIELASADDEPDSALVEHIIRAGAADARATDGTSAFFQAVVHDHLDLARLLLNTGADPNTASRLNGWNALITSVVMGRDANVAWLLTVDTLDPNLADHEGATALHHAARLGRTACVAALLGDPRVEVDAVTGDGVTPLTEALRCGQQDAADLLRQHGANLITDSAPSPSADDTLGHPHRYVSIPQRQRPTGAR